MLIYAASFIRLSHATCAVVIRKLCMKSHHVHSCIVYTKTVETEGKQQQDECRAPRTQSTMQPPFHLLQLQILTQLKRFRISRVLVFWLISCSPSRQFSFSSSLPKVPITNLFTLFTSSQSCLSHHTYAILPQALRIHM